MKKVWQCEDGTIFDSSAAAQNHEKASLEAWIAEMPCMELGAIFNSLDHDKKKEWYGTQRDFGKVFIDRAYEMHNEDLTLTVFGRRNAMPVKK